MIENEESVMTNPGNKSESHKFTRDIIWFSIAQLFVSVILGIFTMPALTKTYTPDIYGVWIQVSVTVMLVSPLVSLQLGLAVVRFLAGEEDKAKRRQALGAMLFAIIIFAVAISLTGALFRSQLSTLLFGVPGYVSYVIFLIIWTSFNAVYNFFLFYLRGRGNIRGVSLCSVAITSLQMIFIVGLARSGAGFESIIVSMIVLQAIFSIGIFVWIIRDIGFPMPNLIGLKTFLDYSIPQMPVVILLWIVSLSDRYFITHFLGLSQTGIYSSSNTIANLTSLFYAPVAFVLFPLISRFWAQNRFDDVKNYFEYSIKLFLTCAIPGAIGIAILSQPLLRLLTTSEFLVGEDLVLLLAFGAVFLGIYQIVINVILLGRHAKLLPLLTAAGSVTSIVMNIILIPRVGIIGAAISNCSAYFVMAAIILLWSRKTIKYDFGFKYIGKVVASSLVMLLSLNFLRVNSIPGIILAIIIGGVVFLTGLFLLRAFSNQEKQLIRNTLSNLIPAYLKKSH